MRKNIINLFTLAVLSSFFSCTDPGDTVQKLTGNEEKLPNELKGLKVYYVSTGNGDGVKVAVLNGEVNSTTYKSGKTTQSVVIVNKQNGKLIEVRQVLVENDSVIVCRK